MAHKRRYKREGWEFFSQLYVFSFVHIKILQWSLQVPLSSTLCRSIVSSLQLTLLATQNGELVCRLEKRNENFSNHKSSLFKPLMYWEVWNCITLDPYLCTYVCHVLLSSMLHEFLWVRKLLMYNILPLGVHRLFYFGTNSWWTGEAANK